MYIHIIGATLNASVLAWQLSAVGHHVYWSLDDEHLNHIVNTHQDFFDDYELSHHLYQQITRQELTILADYQHKEADVIILALSIPQYQKLTQTYTQKQFNHARLLINYSHLELGATQRLQHDLQHENIAYIPDFLQEGNILNSFLTQNLIVGSHGSSEIKQLIQEIFRPIFPLANQYHFMSIQSAEFTKLSISGFLATKVSYMNDLSRAAEALGVDIEEVRTAMATDSRIGEKYLHAGCGFGGENLTRDILTLKKVVQNVGNHQGLLDKIWDINEYQKEIIFRKLWTLFDCQLKGKVIAFWGASFKPNTHRIDQAPILKVLEACWAQGAITQVHDPRALPALKQRYPNQPLLRCFEQQYDAVENADALCLVTEWKQYWSPNYRLLKSRMAQHHLIDGRNIYQPDYVREQGFQYFGIGR